MSATATAARLNPVARLWGAYLRTLAEHPLRTKMATSGTMFFVGDCIAQFGIEGRQVGAPPPAAGHEEDIDAVLPYDPMRAVRLVICELLVVVAVSGGELEVPRWKLTSQTAPQCSARSRTTGTTSSTRSASPSPSSRVSGVARSPRLGLCVKLTPPALGLKLVLDQGVWAPFIVSSELPAYPSTPKRLLRRVRTNEYADMCSVLGQQRRAGG
jgi:protein Mpv17